MLKRHGGFKTGDKVEVLFSGSSVTGAKWLHGFIIEDFRLMKVLVKDIGNVRMDHGPKRNYSGWVSLFTIRHPHLVRRRHG